MPCPSPDSKNIHRMDDNLDVEKYRPVRTRGLRATDLDRRQEQARVQNHGHQVLLQSKMAKLDSREKRSAKDLRRKTESMLDLLKSIQIATPRVGEAEKAGSTSNGLGATAASMTRRRSIVQLSKQERLDSISNVGICDQKDDSVDEDSTHVAPVKNIHLPFLPPGPQGQKYHMRRRYSANDALAESLERFHAYKAGIVKYPSAEKIEEHGDSGIEGDMSTETNSTASVQQNESSHASTSSTELSGGKSPQSVSRCRSRPLTARTKPEVQAHNEFAKKLYEANHSGSKSSPGTLTKSLTCPAAISVDTLPVLRAEANRGKRSENENVENIQGESEGQISPLVPVPQRMEQSLRAARRQSLSAKPATFRSLGGRRNSSPDVFASIPAISLNQRTIVMTRQRSPMRTHRGMRGVRSDDLALNARVKEFLERTDSFIQSSSTDQQLPNIDRKDLANT